MVSTPTQGCRPWRTTALLCVCAGFAAVLSSAACSEKSEVPANPIAPTVAVVAAAPEAAPARIAASVAVPQLEAVPQAGAAPQTPRFEVSADVVFSESGGCGAKITRLTVVVVEAPNELSVSQTFEADIDIPASGGITKTVKHSFEGRGRPEMGTWRLVASGTDQFGRAFEVPPVELPLRFRQPAPVAPPPTPDVVFVGSGDIGVCGSQATAATARLLDGIPGTIFTTGDNVYPHGSIEYYRDCYEPTWGRHRGRTRPTAGNHDYSGDGGNAYYSYFGPNAGPAGLGYYSYNLGGWHIIALNSNLHMNRGSAQYEWLRADLAANRSTACTAAIWHHPLHTSGQNGNNTFTYDAWQLLYDAGADVVLNGHDHIYERFAPQDPDGRHNTRGIRQFTIGTGGTGLYGLRSVPSTSEVRETNAWGVLKFTLKARSYEWEFVPVAGQTFRDFGRADCVP